MYLEPNWLFISWEDKSSKTLINKTVKEIKKPTTDYKSIQTFKATGVYDQSTLMGLGTKLQ